MAIEDDVLRALFDRDHFADRGGPVEGIARRGLDNTYASLSQLQRNVIDPHMWLPCDGVENPGGHHNECTNQLTGEVLVTAVDDEGYYDALLCTDCRGEHLHYEELP